MKRLCGVHAPHRKSTADSVPNRIPVPTEIVIPMSMHIGAPAKPTVTSGDQVKVGQLIAEAAGIISAPIHSSVSGRVKELCDFVGAGGQVTTAIVIESDGEQAVYEDLVPPEVNDLQSFLDAICNSGVVGLGGAGFPTAAKLNVGDLSKIEYVIINGAECEPYITSDTRTMIDNTALVWDGVLLIREYLKVKNIIFGIENNKPQCVEKFEELAKDIDGIYVKSLPAIYPQGGEKVLIYNLTGRMVPEDKLPIDVGTVVINCTTLASIARYIKTGMPLVEKCITVDGSAVSNPQNVIAPIGTPIKNLFDFCGGVKIPGKVLYGGPMMGLAVPNTDVPVLKTTNAVLAFREKDSRQPKETGCIRCGRCIAHCPLKLLPAEIDNAYNLNYYNLLEFYKVNMCMECGCCAYVCPAKKPLVHTMKLSKAALRKYLEQKKAKEAKANG